MSNHVTDGKIRKIMVKTNFLSRNILTATFFSFASFLFAAACVSSVDAHDDSDAIGTWLITVKFDDPTLQSFNELITFHLGGTLTEVNSTLNANSEFDLAAPLKVNGSVGQGAWKRSDSREVSFTFYKMVFCGERSTPAGECINNQLLGYLHVNGVFEIDGNAARQVGVRSNTVLFAPDFETIITDFAGANAEARKLL